MRRALDTAVDRYDIAFCRNQLGDLALAAGDTDGRPSPSTRPGWSPTRRRSPSNVDRRGLAAHERRRRRRDCRLRRPDPPIPDPGVPDRVRRAAARRRTRERCRKLSCVWPPPRTSSSSPTVASTGSTGAALASATGRPADALREAQSEWDRRQFVDVADTLGWALHLSNRDAEALTYAQAGLRERGTARPRYAYHLGMIELALGDRAAARAHLGRALGSTRTFSPLDAPTGASRPGRAGVMMRRTRLIGACIVGRLESPPRWCCCPPRRPARTRWATSRSTSTWADPAPGPGRRHSGGGSTAPRSRLCRTAPRSTPTATVRSPTPSRRRTPATDVHPVRFGGRRPRRTVTVSCGLSLSPASATTAGTGGLDVSRLQLRADRTGRAGRATDLAQREQRLPGRPGRLAGDDRSRRRRRPGRLRRCPRPASATSCATTRRTCSPRPSTSARRRCP